MNQQEFAALFRQAAEHLRSASHGGWTYWITLDPYGFTVHALNEDSRSFQGKVTFEEVYAARHSALTSLIDEAIALAAKDTGEPNAA